MSTFTLDISKFVKKAEGNADKVVRELCLNLLKDIVYDTPVDTGRAKANWFTSIGSPSGATIEFEGGKSPAESLAIGRAMPDIAKATGNVFWISNNLPYIYRLEFEGWSKQAERGMVRIAIDNMKRDLR
jgi:hypothetical protein